MNYRKWVFEDNKEIEKLERLCFPDPWNLRMLADTFLLNNFCGIICEDNEKIVGYVGCTYCLESAEIDMIAVIEEYRHNGIASCLIEKLCEELKTQSVEQIFLEVRRSNFVAQKCYVKNGFEVIGIRKNYYEQKEDAILMKKTLTV